MAKLQQVFSLALDEKKNLYAPIDFIKNTFYAMFFLSFLNTVRVNVCSTENNQKSQFSDLPFRSLNVKHPIRLYN